jgi:hypothetical protein
MHIPDQMVNEEITQVIGSQLDRILDKNKNGGNK